MKKTLVMMAVVVMVLSLSIMPVMAAPDKSIVEIAVGNSDFSILVAALQKADLVEALQGDGPFTVFAPTNAAFEDLLKALNISAEQLLAQPDLSKVLLYHVVSGKVMSTDLTNGLEAATLNGEKVKFDLSASPMVNQSKITAVDLEATNGVIHVVDKVLVPSNFKLVDVAATTEVPKTEDYTVFYVAGLVLAAASLMLVGRKLSKARN